MARNTMKKQFSLNDHLFNRESVTYLAGLFKGSDTTFRDADFIEEVCARMQPLALKERIICIAQVLHEYLPKDFKNACKKITKALPPPLDPTRTDDDFGSFIFAPLGEYVKQYGLGKEDLFTSYDTLHAITQRFSMEDAIRAFINAYPEETLQRLRIWASDTHYHVRRLVSEGTRSLLPWSGRIVYTSTQTLPLLDMLYSDKTRYVTRSVANHLNDIAKKDASAVIERLMKWCKEGKQEEVEMQWITKHALRTLIKQGNQNALELLGYNLTPAIAIDDFILADHSLEMRAGEALEFEVRITAQEDVSLMIDYAIGFNKANGEIKERIFKLKKTTLKKGEVVHMVKRHRLLKDATTYKLYPGSHTLTVQINGVRSSVLSFTIV